MRTPIVNKSFYLGLLIAILSLPTAWTAEVNSFSLSDYGSSKKAKIDADVRTNPKEDAILGTAYQLPEPWQYEKPSSFLYLTYNQQNIANAVYVTGNYNTTYSQQLYYPSLDYHQLLGHLSEVEGHGILQRTGIWLRYGIGFGIAGGATVNSNYVTSGSVANSQILFANALFGPKISFDLSTFFSPYIGAAGIGIPYRQASAASSIEKQGVGLGGAAFIGLDIPVRWFGNMSINLEARSTTQFSDSDHFLNMNGYGVGGGIGVFL